MGILNDLLTFVGSMHLSAIIIISIILVIFFLSLILNLALRGRYAKLRAELERQSAIGRRTLAAARDQNGAGDDRFSEPRFRSPFLRGIATDFEAAWTAQHGVEVNTQAIIEGSFNSRMKGAIIEESFTRHAVSLMIVLGLLGTFIGLTISVQSLVLLFRGYDVTELLSSVESGLLSALAGMSTAFTTSLFGIACSVIITFINVFINPGQARENLMTGIEEYLDNTVSARLRGPQNDGYEKMNDTLRSTFIEFGERIAERFDRSLLALRDDVRGIEDVNNNLRNTIEQMDVSFVRIADVLKASTRHVDDNYRALSNLSAQLKATSDGFDGVRKENEQNANNLVRKVAEAAQAVGALTGDLRGESQRRLDSFTSYEASVAAMAKSAELIRGAVAAIPEQMYAYSIAQGVPAAAWAPGRLPHTYANAATNPAAAGNAVAGNVAYGNAAAGNTAAGGDADGGGGANSGGGADGGGNGGDGGYADGGGNGGDGGYADDGGDEGGWSRSS